MATTATMEMILRQRQNQVQYLIYKQSKIKQQTLLQNCPKAQPKSKESVPEKAGSVGSSCGSGIRGLGSRVQLGFTV